MKKLLQYINNERNDIRIKGIKSCDSTSYDECALVDKGSCSVYATDDCTMTEDYYGCTEGGHDYCDEGDWTTCHGAGNVDWN